MHAVFLLQKGHGDQLASDIAGFIMDESHRDFQSVACDRAERTAG